MKVQQVQQQSVMPEGANSSVQNYRVIPGDYQQINADAPLLQGLNDVGRTANRAAEMAAGTIAATVQKVQVQKDRLATTDITGMLNADLSNFQTTLDQKKDDERIAMIREATMKRISDNKLVSESARKELTARMGYALDQFAVENNHRRGAMVVRQNIANSQRLLGDAIASGNVSLAVEQRDWLEKQGVAVPSRQKVSSLGVLGEWSNRIQTMSHQEMQAELDDVQQNLRNGKNVSYLDMEDSRKLADVLKKNMQIRQNENYAKYQARYLSGDLTYSELLGDYEALAVDDYTFAALQKDFQRSAATWATTEIEGVLLSQSAGKLTQVAASDQLRDIRGELKIMVQSGEIDADMYGKIDNAARHGDLQGVNIELERKKQASKSRSALFDWDITNVPWPVNVQQRDELQRRMLAAVIADPEMGIAEKGKLRKALQESRDAFEQPDKATTGNPAYKHIESLIKNDVKEGNYFYVTGSRQPFWNRLGELEGTTNQQPILGKKRAEMSDTEKEYADFQLMKAEEFRYKALDMIRRHPTLSLDEAQKWYRNEVTNFQKGIVPYVYAERFAPSADRILSGRRVRSASSGRLGYLNPSTGTVEWDK